MGSLIADNVNIESFSELQKAFGRPDAVQGFSSTASRPLQIRIASSSLDYFFQREKVAWQIVYQQLAKSCRYIM